MKARSEYICQQCGYKSSSFLGKCPECGEWNSLVESVEKAGSGPSASLSGLALENKIFQLSDIRSWKIERFTSGFLEFDRVLGGGIVAGSIVLISGDPGIGKSTLLLQCAMAVAKESKVTKEPKEPKAKKTSDSSGSSVTSGHPVLYVSGEESAQQIKMRAERLARPPSTKAEGVVGQGKITPNLYILPETDIEIIIAAAEKLTPALLIIDSIQTLTTDRLTGSAGSLGQLRECAQILQRYAKGSQTPVFMVGHVTKEGAIAGPKVLEHIVDAVLNLEGDDMHAFRILRSSKNRFGSTYEIGVFEMQDKGMVEVLNPSQIFIDERVQGRAGSVVGATIAGGRPLLAEIQALCTQTVFAVPTRRVTGLDFSRVQIIIAALSKAAKLSFANMDVFASAAGGIKIVEPAADLPIALAVVSAMLDKPLGGRICAFGEVGLLGEIRSVIGAKQRINEAKRLGFDDIVSPERFKTLEEAIGHALHNQS